MIGKWTRERPPATAAGPVVWICADDLYPTLTRVAALGGTVAGRPRSDNGERWLAEIEDRRATGLALSSRSAPHSRHP